MSLDLSSLEKAVASLERVLVVARAAETADPRDDDVFEGLRAGVIHIFEITYEICWKLMKRWIANNVNPETASPRTRKDLFRTAAAEKLISDPLPWFDYHKARNKTVHIYQEECAKEVYLVCKTFAGDAAILLAGLRERND